MMGATASPGCKFHLGCKSMRLSHMVFADDLMLFCNAEGASIKCSKMVFQRFSEVWAAN